MALVLPSSVWIEPGARRRVADEAAALDTSRALVVADAFLTERGVTGEIVALLEEAEFAVAVFDEIEPDPTDAAIDEGRAALVRHEADVVVAVGGGSVLDAAKTIAVRGANPGPLRQYMGYGQLAGAGLPVIAIPTTAGTGSEATRVVVVTDIATDTKMMLLDDRLVPKVALVDVELSATMPRPLTAHVGVDTLTHGIEAYVSQKATPETDELARSCVALCGRHLEAAWRDGSDLEARAGMARAAYEGGAAFANSSVCLVHGMSRPLGAVFHVPHGLSNAVLLPAVTAFSLPGAPERYAEVARAFGVATDGDDTATAGQALLDALERLNAALEVPRLRDLRGVDRETFDAALPKMAADALDSGSPDRNPVVPTQEEIEELYRRAW
ncbi:iron-containing alcohol dehydrogenase [Patulibacter americanus]|uniref:iron-containing alcohol dehydrogenase n=1 Tax=Patulibacter americanus TaxID=588672 RepID=UPI0003B4F2B0|nr:iron-containing alcohol dehydrogenase [Patulibacter americanus]